jgi:hypothetical protein
VRRGIGEMSCPASFPFWSNCIFPVSPSFIVFCFQEARIRLSAIFCNVVPHYRHKKTLPCSASVSIETKRLSDGFFVLHPWSQMRFLTDWPKMDTVVTPSSYKTLETMAEVRHRSPRVIRSLTTPPLIKWHPLQPTITPLLLRPLPSNVGTASAIPAVRSRTHRYRNFGIVVAV